MGWLVVTEATGLGWEVDLAQFVFNVNTLKHSGKSLSFEIIGDLVGDGFEIGGDIVNQDDRCKRGFFGRERGGISGTETEKPFVDEVEKFIPNSR